MPAYFMDKLKMELKEFKKQAKELAVKCGLNKSDVLTDYDVAVKNSSGGSYSGLIITKA